MSVLSAQLEGKPLIEPSVPAAASRAPLGTTRCGIGSSPWRIEKKASVNWEGAVDEWEEGAVVVIASEGSPRSERERF